MKRLHRYILGSFSGPLILTFFIVMFLLIMQFLWRYIDDLVGKGLTFQILAELLFYLAASFVPMALPLAILLAALMTFGNLGENFELTAMKSSGIPLQRIMLPVFFLMLILTGFSFYFSNNILPIANLKSRSLLWDIQHQRPELNIKTGEFYNGIDGYSVKIGGKNFKTNMLYRILIYDHTEKKGNTSVTYADSGLMHMTPDETKLFFTLYHGRSYNEIAENERNKRNRINRTFPFREDDFDKQTLMIPLTGFGLKRTDENLFKNNYSMLNLGQLTHTTDSLEQQLDQRENMYLNNLIRSQYLIFSLQFSKLHEHDTAGRLKAKVDSTGFDLWSAFYNLPRNEKESIVDQAQGYARGTMKYIQNNSNSFSSRIKYIRRHQIEWHRKFTLSLACVIFFFIGAPLGAIIRRGGLGMPIVISVVFFVFYYIISMSGEKFVREDVWSPFTGMWISTFILLPIGIFLTYKSTTDSAIMSSETYTHTLKRVLNWIKLSWLRKRHSKKMRS